jgi:hypothetical protein
VDKIPRHILRQVEYVWASYSNRPRSWVDEVAPVWADQLGDLPPAILAKSVKTLCQQGKHAPTPAAIRKWASDNVQRTSRPRPPGCDACDFTGMRYIQALKDDSRSSVPYMFRGACDACDLGEKYVEAEFALWQTVASSLERTGYTVLSVGDDMHRPTELSNEGRTWIDLARASEPEPDEEQHIRRVDQGRNVR